MEKDKENLRERKKESLKKEPVKNPNPAANANVQRRTSNEPRKNTSSQINSEITDGEDG